MFSFIISNHLTYQINFNILQLFNISTTVDPSYIISLIRKLLPEQTNNHLDSVTQVSNENKCHDQQHNVGNDSWEEYGCILWDLATSKTHAEFMVTRS